jgi:hypothetical protein
MMALCPRCGKVHKTLRPALMCLHAWQASVETPGPDDKERIFTMDEYMALQKIVEKLGG